MAASAPAATVAAGSPASLRGRTVLVFGGSSGMGKAAAVSVVQAGGIAWIVGRDGAKVSMDTQFGCVPSLLSSEFAESCSAAATS